MHTKNTEYQFQLGFTITRSKNSNRARPKIHDSVRVFFFFNTALSLKRVKTPDRAKPESNKVANKTKAKPVQQARKKITKKDIKKKKRTTSRQHYSKRSQDRNHRGYLRSQTPKIPDVTGSGARKDRP